MVVVLPDHHHHQRLLCGCGNGPGAGQREDLLDLPAQGGLELLAVVQLLAAHLLAGALEQGGGGLHPDVGGEEDLLQLGEGLLVDGLRRAEEPRELAHEARAGAGQPLGQGPSGDRLDLLLLRCSKLRLPGALLLGGAGSGLRLGAGEGLALHPAALALEHVLGLLQAVVGLLHLGAGGVPGAPNQRGALGGEPGHLGLGGAQPLAGLEEQLGDLLARGGELGLTGRLGRRLAPGDQPDQQRQHHHRQEPRAHQHRRRGHRPRGDRLRGGGHGRGLERGVGHGGDIAERPASAVAATRARPS
jgi:hypothetical protein